jgi:DNA-directed RNA polymerase III subunit RPC1
MMRLAKMAARTMGDLGFSIGIDDVTPADMLQRAKMATVQDGYNTVQQYIKQFQKVSGAEERWEGVVQ